jgi:predicted short-subunit dehydrogenase-like oxidoreductase (DUF2520 family)
MLPGMAGKLRIALVGAGNVGSALAVSLRRAGYPIEALVARSNAASLGKARRLAKKVGGHAVRFADLGKSRSLRAEVIWICVPDSEIAHAAHALADKVEWKGRVALHSSGALISDELAPLRAQGAAVGSAHPLMTFVRGASFGNSKVLLAGVPFAIEGDAKAVRAARALVADMGGEAYAIRKEHKAAYHAWGMFASPLLDALMATTERVARLAGVRPKDARRRMIPILRQTLANYAALGAPGAFSGPIVRGDVETVRTHLKVLRAIPVAFDVYVALAKAALEYLPAKEKSTPRKLLSSEARTHQG